MKLFQWLTLCIASFTLALWLASCSSPPLQAISLNLGASNSMRGVLAEVVKLYANTHPNIVINYAFSGGSSLKAAIEQGEPFDGIVITDSSQLDALQAKGKILPESRRDLGTTDIVLVARADSTLQVSDFKDIASDRIKTVALSNKNLISGKYTLTLLNRLGIAQAVEPKAVLAKNNVREVLWAVEKGDAEVGITYILEAKVAPKLKVLAVAPSGSYEQIRISGGVVKTSTYPQETQAYLDFLASDQVKEVFQQFGLRPLRS